MSSPYDMSVGVECPVTCERYEASGPHQPRFLPGCGHSFSQACIERLLDASGAGQQLRCPICNKASPTVKRVEDCTPNWTLISIVSAWAERRQEQAEAAVRTSTPFLLF